MALWECAECTTRYAVGAPKCPHCGSVVRLDERTRKPEEEDGAMPKITRHGGPTNEAEDGEQPSVGSSSETSSEKPSTPPETSETGTRKRARTTGSRSKQGRTEDSSAPSTDGGLEAGGSETGSAAE